MISYHTLNHLTENVYMVNDTYDQEDIDYELGSFFSALMNRRRNDEIEEGLQAGGVIYSDRAGFKISERDGRGSHAQAQENVSQYINGEVAFSGPETIGMIMSRKNDPNAWMNIPKNGFTVRIVATEELLIFIFYSYLYKTTDFQMDVIYKLFDYIKTAYQENKIKYPYINFVMANKKFVFDEYKDIDEQLNKLESVLLKEQNKKTK